MVKVDFLAQNWYNSPILTATNKTLLELLELFGKCLLYFLARIRSSQFHLTSELITASGSVSGIYLNASYVATSKSGLID